MEKTEIIDVCRMDYRCFASNHMYKAFFPKNTAGDFKCPVPYLREIDKTYSTAVIGYHFTAGFFNVIDDAPIHWLVSQDDSKFFSIGKGYLKKGYYPTAEHLTMAINSVIFELDAITGRQYNIKYLPLLEITDDGHVRITAERYKERPEEPEWQQTLQLAQPIARMLGCTASGDCKTAYVFRFDRFHSRERPGVLVDIQKPSMKPPYNKLYLFSNLSAHPLLEFEVDFKKFNIMYYPDSPKYTKAPFFETGKHMTFYFTTDKGERVGKEGTTSLILSFRATHCLKPEERAQHDLDLEKAQAGRDPPPRDEDKTMTMQKA